MIRRAQPADERDLVELALKWAGEYPDLRPEVEKIRAVVRQGISGAAHFFEISISGSELKGATLAMVDDHLWAQRKQAHVLFWASEVPGDGAQMLRNLVAWARGRRAIRVIGMSPDLEVDPRALKVAERIGFERRGGDYILINGARHGTIQRNQEGL